MVRKTEKIFLGGGGRPPIYSGGACQQGTRVGTAQSDARRCGDPGVYGGGAVSGGPVPELADEVPAPALDRGACEQGARV